MLNAPAPSCPSSSSTLALTSGGRSGLSWTAVRLRSTSKPNVSPSIAQVFFTGGSTVMS
ncbi:hypothetical protein GXW82_10635 [Streptacidiphilus sp. 4-A2]|nr:hypothetical protein [Streptacidiphilus sp. 4-A2]